MYLFTVMFYSLLPSECKFIVGVRYYLSCSNLSLTSPRDSAYYAINIYCIHCGFDREAQRRKQGWIDSKVNITGKRSSSESQLRQRDTTGSELQQYLDIVKRKAENISPVLDPLSSDNIWFPILFFNAFN